MRIRHFARATLLAGIALAAVGAANADVFMKVDGAPGDTNARGFEGQILLNGATMNVSNVVLPDPDGGASVTHQLSVGSMFLTKTPDRSSPKLMMAAVQGKPLGSVEITFTAPARPGQPQTVDSKWILEGAEVRSFNANPDVNVVGGQAETIELSFTSMRYQYFAKDAKGQRTGSMEEVKFMVPADQVFPGDSDCR
ncbi:MAG TPA: type VI secretion system tube protein Hcp [Hyphomonadaceae bacterium]|nr:type VI secretion system tube protein Hcp [Hyphomonadaceae bacterium]